MSESLIRRGTRRQRRALDLYVKLMRASSSVSFALQQNMSGHDLTETQFGVLEALGHLGELTQRELGRKLFRSPANITAVIDQLERRDLVQRTRHHTDRRCNTVALSTQGKELLERTFPPRLQRLCELASALSEEEQETLAALCRQLGLAAVDGDGRVKEQRGQNETEQGASA